MSDPKKKPPKRTRPYLTGRTAILAIVVCAIALSMAYPIREYVAQRQEISHLREQERINQRQVDELARRKQRLGDQSYIRREARRRLHYCMPDEKCYVVVGSGGGNEQDGSGAGPPPTPPWYVNLWRSVDGASKTQ